MEEFKTLLTIIDRLLSPDGCPWDREQTLQSMRSSVLEETSEVIEAIDLNDNQKIEEELGDLLFNVAFLCKLAEKEQRFNVIAVLNQINEKLIRRHPHVFGHSSVQGVEDVLQQWDKIKSQEKAEKPKSVLESIPKNLPALMRAQKMLKKIKKTSYHLEDDRVINCSDDEEQLGKFLFQVVLQASSKGIEPEQALKKYLSLLEADFKLHESADSFKEV